MITLPGWVADGKGSMTVLFDGVKCMVINDQLYCFNPYHLCDPVKDRWLFAAMQCQYRVGYAPGKACYAVGKHINGNPYNIDYDTMVGIRARRICAKMGPNDSRTIEGIAKYIVDYKVYGIQFWRDMKPEYQITRLDLGLPWPIDGGCI